ncbi:MAG: NAD(P)/FAD-dependent oxidoreductase, partial [Terriglobales bacterium]
RKVEFILNTKVTGYSEEFGVQLSNGRMIRPVVFIWTAGVTANPLVRTLPCKIERGKIVANQNLEVEGYPFLFACGDCAYITDPLTGKPYPPTAQHASRMGKIVAKNIEARIRGTALQPFVYKSQGALAAIGRRSGVANIMGFKFSGLFAWILWRAIYLMKLPRLEKKVRVAIEWTLDLLFPKDMVQFLTLNTPLVQNVNIQTTTQPHEIVPGEEQISKSQPGDETPASATPHHSSGL